MPRAASIALMVLALAAVPALAACGDDDPEPRAAGTTPSGTPEPAPAAPTTTAPPARTATTPDIPPDSDVRPKREGMTRLAPPDATPRPAERPRETTVVRPERPVWCPAGGARQAPGARDRFDARDLLGAPLADAQAVAARRGCSVRVVRRDGRELVRTMDYSNGRVNVAETDGRIVRLVGIG